LRLQACRLRLALASCAGILYCCDGEAIING
jgi:hypothetical protein